jgi:hypothetical protein
VDNDIRSVLHGVEGAARQLNRVWQEPPVRNENVEPMGETAVEPSPTWRWRPIHSLIVLSSALLLAGLFVAWLLLDENGKARGVSANGRPALVSQTQLERLASKAGHPVYWAGPRPGYSYEATITGNGRFYVRYLPHGVRAGDPRASFLVVGTYTAPGSFAGLRQVAKRPGSISVGTSRGGIAVFASAHPTSVYFSYPGASYQVEVYSPSADTARGLVLGGKVTPIPTG